MQRVLAIVSLLLTLIVVGTVSLRFIEDASWVDSLFVSVMTLSTVGLKDTLDLSELGKVFVVVYIILGLSLFTYGAFHLGQWVISAELRSLWEKRRMARTIDKLRDHFIICGNGRMGETLCRYLQERDKPFVVVDTNEDSLIPICEARGWLFILGDATDDDVLRQAGIDDARSLASVLPTDADNVYVVLSARMLNPKLQIVARAMEEKAIEKMERAGASRVISPFSSGAIKMARFMLYPSVEDFLEVTDTQSSDLELADVLITEDSPYVGKQLMETGLRQKGVMVIGIRRANGDRLMPPAGTAEIQPGDCLFAFGSTESVNHMIGETDRA